MSLAGFQQWTQSLVFAGYSVSQFTTSLVSGGPAIQGFLSSLENLTSSVLKYSTQAFDKATENEVNRLAAGGAISNSFSKKISFDEGLELFDDLKVKLAKSAASLPGTTADYITVFRSLSDDMATALNSAGAGGAALKQLFKDKVPQAVEKLVLQTKLYGQDIPVSSITRTYSKLLSTGKVNSREIFVQRNPVLRTGIEQWEKANAKKLPQLNIRERFDALNKIFADSISSQQMDGLKGSFQAKIETIKSFLFDPDVGMFGFEREFKNSSGETTTIFKTLTSAIGPVIDRFADLAQNIIIFADPAQFAANFFDSTVGIALKDFGERLGVLNQIIQITEGNFETKLHAALKAAFSFDYKTFDFAAAITKFFDKLAKNIENFGDNIRPDDKFGKAMEALLNGLFKVVGAILGRAARQAAEHPKESFQFVALTNPGLIFNAFTALTTSFLVLAPIAKLLFSTIASLASLAFKIPIVTSLFGALANIATAVSGVFVGIAGAAVIVIAFVAGLVIFKEQLLAAGKHFTELSNAMSGPFKDATQILGWSLTKLGEAGSNLAKAWTEFTAGDWRGAIVSLFKGLVKAIQGLFGLTGTAASAALGAITVAWEGMLPVLKQFGMFLLDGLVNLLTGSKSLDKLTDKVSSAPVVQTKNGNILDSGLDAYKTWHNRLNATLGLDPVFSNFTGNAFGGLLDSLAAEKANMPSGASLAIANSSEAILTQGQSQVVASALTNKAGASIGNVNVYVSQSNATAQDIGMEVRNQLIALLA
jgi:hypothetical protein